MNYSTEHITKMNISEDANATFLSELKRTDRARYDNLIRNMEREVGRLRLRAKVVEIAPATERTCAQCGLKLPTDLRMDAKFCDDACKTAFSRSRKAA